MKNVEHRKELTEKLRDIVLQGRYTSESDADTIYDAIDMLNSYRENSSPGNDYVLLKDIHQFPIRRDHYDKENGNDHFINGIETLMEYIDLLPRYKTENEDAITDIYKEIKDKWRSLRQTTTSPKTLKFLVHLMEEIEENIFYPEHCGEE